MSFLEFHRRHRQHANDIEALYKLVAKTDQRVDVIDTKVSSILDVQRDHSVQLSRVQSTLEAHTAALAEHEVRFDAIDARLDGQSAQLNSQGELLKTQGQQLNRIIELLSGQRPETN